MRRERTAVAKLPPIALRGVLNPAAQESPHRAAPGAGAKNLEGDLDRSPGSALIPRCAAWSDGYPQHAHAILAGDDFLRVREETLAN